MSGAQAYRDGEWLYQDFLQDDHGATGTKDENDPYGVGAHLYSPAGGTFTYPTDKVYANNAADLVELSDRKGTPAVQLSGGSPVYAASLAYAYGVAGRRAEAARLLGDLEATVLASAALARRQTPARERRYVDGALLHALQEADDTGYSLVCGALAQFDVRDRLAALLPGAGAVPRRPALAPSRR